MHENMVDKHAKQIVVLQRCPKCEISLRAASAPGAPCAHGVSCIIIFRSWSESGSLSFQPSKLAQVFAIPAVAMSVNVINLNRLPYRKALYIQQKLFQKVKQAESQESKTNYLLLVEHEPVYTVGIRSKQYLDTAFQEKLNRLGADFEITNRGGLITFHGPGQLVAYPIINLTHFAPTGKSIKKFVCILESVIIDTCRDLGIIAARLHPHPGVWVEENRKIAAIGIHASKYVTMHGIALNCAVDLQWYEHIVPCGIEDKLVTSVSNELKRKVTVSEVSPLFVDHFSKQLQCDIK